MLFVQAHFGNTQDLSLLFLVVRTHTRVAVSAFERAAIGGAFEVATNGVSDMNQIIPPAKINDLRRGQMGEESLELLWTAVGGSMNDGTGNDNFRHMSDLDRRTIQSKFYPGGVITSLAREQYHSCPLRCSS